jgi:predicted dehydrogenase
MPRRFSLIGTGFGELHARYLRALGWQLDSVYCRSQVDKAQALCDALGGRAARRIDEADPASDDAELMVVSSYPEGRLALLRSLDAPGRTLLVDKPFCGHEPGLEPFLRQCRGQVRAFFQWRHHPAIAALRADLRGHAPVELDIRFMHDFLAQAQPAFLWRHARSQATGGAIADLGIHCIDLACFLLGPVTLVESELRIEQPTRSAGGRTVVAETDDAGALALASAEGSRARLQFSRVADRRSLGLQVRGALDARIDIDPDGWWCDPAALAPDDWRLACYRDLLDGDDAVRPSIDSIVNGHSIYLQALSVKESERV